MAAPWTTEQIFALAPDPASARAGKGLAARRHWLLLGADAEAAWGECQGSGKAPYRTAVDFRGAAFTCSCPSRKFPCKHALGLLMLLDADPASCPEAARPAWAAEWLEARAERERKRAAPKPAAAAATGAAARPRRAPDRRARTAAGISDLERWMHDAVRAGLAAARAQGYRFWESPAARMVDAQAPGVARMLREMGSTASSGEGWEARLLEQFGRLHLLVEGFKRLDELSPETRADVEARLGWALSREEVLAAPAVRDTWAVLGSFVEEEERMRVQRTWLLGAETGRRALVLSFAAGREPLDQSLVPGTTLDAELAFYPGGYPLRALVKERFGAADWPREIAGLRSVEEAAAELAAALARDPWVERFPFALGGVVPVRAGDGWAVRDAGGSRLPVAARFAKGWTLLAASGGGEVGLFGEWDGEALAPSGAWSGERYYRL